MLRRLGLALLVGFVGGSSQTSLASIQAGDVLNFQRLSPNAVGNFAGGPFAVREWNSDLSATGDVVQHSICLERNEYLPLGINAKLKVAGISNAAKSGGLGGPNPDPLDEQTQFLYYQFATGNLSSIDLAPYSVEFTSPTYFDYATSDSNRALQNAIWTLEQEGTSGLSGDSSDFMDALLALAMASVAGSDEPWLSSVRVLNLEYLNGQSAQDQLVLVSAPEASALTVWATLCMVTLGSSHRTRKRGDS